MFIHPSPLQLLKPLSPSLNTPKPYSDLLKIHEQSIVACILSLSSVIILSSIIFAIAYPSAVFIIVLSLAFSLVILCCLLDFINTKTSSIPSLQQSSFNSCDLLTKKYQCQPKVRSVVKAPTVLPQYNDLLDTLWTEARWRDLPHQIRPLPDSIQQAVWRLNGNPEIILISTVGDVTLPRTTSECTLMMVNPTNAEMTREDIFWGRYTFYKTVSTDCWNRAKQTSTKHSYLAPGTCSKKCLWETIDESRNPPHTGLPFWFSHVYNPLSPECYTPLSSFEICKETYIKCFEEAISGEIPATMVQIPLLFSESIRRDQYDDDLPFDNPYLKAAKAALVVALQEFSDRNPNSSLTVVVVRERGMPVEHSYQQTGN
ncbi:hypothetical protein [Chlamydia buteonis]|uniref:Macro domain-containing protein n=1 Tax=Chlamydia buteonis TaxID=2494525 RepID=A0ABX8L996_9CHLA|nr:hypothetical protein [Chlamydia buteonis]QXE27191.1 hypothetical protein HBN95_03515 [Chlamydia buteonis]QXE27889.1 hypothetical protein JJJ19_04685 [Chlamydia buteonis]